MAPETISFTAEPANFETVFENDIERLKDDIEPKLDKLLETKNPVMYVFVNKGLNMNAGKVAAQVAHAQAELFLEFLDHSDNEARKFQYECMRQQPNTVIILETRDTDELYKINSYLESCGIRTGIYVDEGSADGNYLLEPTAMACQYLDKNDPRVQLIFRMFKLYEQEGELTPHLEKACSILEHVSYLACHPSEKKFLGDIHHSKFRLDILEDAAEWDEYTYKNNLLKYIKPRETYETETNYSGVRHRLSNVQSSHS